ncbi:hypothetical protein BDB01DRAFT_796478 [Pilobolus umbonatus]|nr:hypothetical protein BDB01DRAFT_796478 [Pilobolus umbonatus]
MTEFLLKRSFFSKSRRTVQPEGMGARTRLETMYSFAPRYVNDPMRNTKYPDVVGTYYDPMGCGRPVYTSYDNTNTGA